jgi:hypothetical protein
MTMEELKAELRQSRLESLVKTLTKWANEETEVVQGDRWCEGYAEGYNRAKKLIRDLLDIIELK